MIRVEHDQRELTLREVQRAALDVLKKVDCICRSEKLTYWLAYGTVIGAVRHKGFIPWDDDIDICMPRKDYDALLGYFKEHERELYPFVAVGPSKEVLTPFLITRISNMEYVMEGEFGDEVRLGAFIDIYPLDGIGSEEAEADAYKKYMKKLANSYFRSGDWDYYNHGVSPAKRLMKRLVSRLSGNSPKHLMRLLSASKKYQYDSSEYVSVIVGMTYMPFCRRKCYEDTCYVEFEDMMAPIPSGYDEILRAFYGDYMRLPPENERIGHHFYRLFKANAIEVNNA